MNFHTHPFTYVSHVHLIVANLSRSLTFYQELIGFQVLQQHRNKAVLTADGKTALLTIEEPELFNERKPNTTGLYHFALLLPSRIDLGSVLLHLLEKGYPLEGASDHDVSEALYLSDPDGNGIEIYSDRPTEEWRWQHGSVTMTTVQLDVDSLLADGRKKAWQGLPAETVMGHIHLHVSELKQTEEFYTKGLGFDVVLKYGPQAMFISTGGYHHHIGLNTWSGVGASPPEENSPGLRWFALVLPNEDEREKTVARLKQLGAYLHQEENIFYTKDPSGNMIQLLV